MTTNIDENIKSFRQIYSDCSDIKMQEMYLGRDASIKCFVAYIEVTCAGSGINNSAFGRFTSYLEGIDRDKVKEVLDKNQAALSEFAHLHTVREAAQMMLTGDVIFLWMAIRMPLSFQTRDIPPCQFRRLIRKRS